MNITAHVRDSNFCDRVAHLLSPSFSLKAAKCGRLCDDAERHRTFSVGKGPLSRILPCTALSAIQTALQHDGGATATIFIHPCRYCRFTIQFAVEGALGGIRFIPPRESLREFALVIGPGRIENDSRSSFSSRAWKPPLKRFLDKVDENGLGKYSRRRCRDIEYRLSTVRVIPRNASKKNS